MTLFVNNNIECFVVSNDHLFALKAVQLSSFTLNSVSVITQKISDTAWQERLHEFPKRQLQLNIQMLNHNDSAEHMLQHAALEGTSIIMHIRVNTDIALQAEMHIQQYDCEYAQNELEVIRMRLVNIENVDVVPL